MTLEGRLAEYVLENYPARAVIALERLGEEETIERLGRGSVESAAAIVRRLSPQYVRAVLRSLDPERVARMLESLPNDTAARLMRNADDATRERLLEELQPKTAARMRAVLRFPEASAGALMDPDVLALPQTLTAREALSRVRHAAKDARYNLYVVDQDQRLVGVLNLRELLIAAGRKPLSDLMVRDPHSLPATADRASVISHPGWREVHSIPVVDDENVYLGAIRYRVLRRLEEELLAPRSRDADTGAALGDLFSAGVRGVLDAMSSPTPNESGRS